MSDSAHTFYWKNVLKLSPQLSLTGYSRAAENTGFYYPQLEMAFDAGVQMNAIPAYICLTHLHNDHVCAISKMLIENPKTPTIFIPNNDKFEELLVTMLKLMFLSSKFVHPDSDKGKNPNYKYPYHIVKLNVGQSYQFKETTNGAYMIEGLPSVHGVCSISYGIYEMRKKCKAEYQNLPCTAYADLKKNNIEFRESYKHPLICFMSDTNISCFTEPYADLIFNYPFVIIECTFFLQDDLKQSVKKKHIHWIQLEPYIRDRPKVKFLLTHFSKRYTWLDVKNFFDNVNSINPLNNIIVWIHSGPIDYSVINKSYLK